MWQKSNRNQYERTTQYSTVSAVLELPWRLWTCSMMRVMATRSEQHSVKLNKDVNECDGHFNGFALVSNNKHADDAVRRTWLILGFMMGDHVRLQLPLREIFLGTLANQPQRSTQPDYLSLGRQHEYQLSWDLGSKQADHTTR